MSERLEKFKETYFKAKKLISKDELYEAMKEFRDLFKEWQQASDYNFKISDGPSKEQLASMTDEEIEIACMGYDLEIFPTRSEMCYEYTFGDYGWGY